jgi:hypothetical protein
LYFLNYQLTLLAVFGLPPDIVGAALGGLGVQQVADLESLIPDNVILGVDECLARCGITRTGQPTAQRQPRVSANAFPASITPTNVFSLPTASATAAAEPTESAAPESSASPEASAAPESSAAPEASTAPESSAAAEPSAAEPTPSASEASAEPTTSANPSAKRAADIVTREDHPEFMQFALRR